MGRWLVGGVKRVGWRIGYSMSMGIEFGEDNKTIWVYLYGK